MFERVAQLLDPADVVVVARHQPDQILDRGQTALRQSLGHRRSDPGQRLRRCRQRIDRVVWPRNPRFRPAAERVTQPEPARDLERLAILLERFEALDRCAKRPPRWSVFFLELADHAITCSAQLAAQARQGFQPREPVARGSKQWLPQRLDVSQGVSQGF
jgi:hypothetical protein